MKPHLPALLLALLLSPALHAAQLETIEVPGETLRGNPLGDPLQRPVAIFTPDGSKQDAALPMVVYLPGWGGSSEDAIAEGRGGWLGRQVDRLAREKVLLRIAVVDGRSRYGGSQFLNSEATGNYADYVADEVVPLLAKRYGCASWIIAGHSSGGYGALLLAIHRHDKFGAVVALSPDSDFEVTHKAMVQQATMREVTPADLEKAITKGQFHDDWFVKLAMGLCANYAPIKGKPGHFEWLYDAKGQWRPEAWQRWLDLDPLTVVRKNEEAFAPEQRVYLDGAEHDEFGANIGARKIQEVLSKRKSPVIFYQAPGHHADHLGDRLKKGLLWVLGDAMK